MEKTEVIRLFEPTFGKTMIAELTALARNAEVPVERLHDLCYDRSNDQIAFRSAWVLEYIATHDEKRFSPLLPTFMYGLPQLQNRSCQRHFTKILMWITNPKSPETYRNFLLQADKDNLVEVVFGWLIDPDTPVAVQVNCLDIVLQLAGHADWIPEELEKQTHYLLRTGSPAMQSRGKRVLEKLKKIKNAD